MAYLERIRFTFFDQKENVDSGKIHEAVGKARVSACASGYGLITLGDSSGNVHIVTKAFVVRTFKAYNLSVTLAEQSRTSPYLVTIGEDGGGINPLVKVWNLEKNDKNDIPVCMKIMKASIPNQAVVPTCLSLLDNLSMVAVGFNDGSILIFRGDVKRERSIKQTVLKVDYKNEVSSLTGLALYQKQKAITLYASTVNSTEMFDVSHKDKEKKITLDEKEGCSLRCSVLAENDGNQDFYVARSKAVFCFTNGILGPCYAVEGEKFQLQWFRGYLVIIAKVAPSSIKFNSKNKDSGQICYALTILDVMNNATAYNTILYDVSAIIIEWNSLFILTADNNLMQIVEKDLQSKLALLFKKNLYDVAIKVAKYHQYDADGLMEIFRQYGDYLYSKGDHKGAIEQYIKTIGKLEPSYVIRKYMGSQQVENLTTYLQALHKEGVANGGHTTLLLNFYTKLNKPQLLKEFIMTKDKDVDFDVEVAIDVCRHVSSEDALILAEKHSRHDWYLTIQIEDRKRYKEALDYIAKLDFHKAEFMIKKHGITLLEHEPLETTKFLIRLCTDYKPSDEPLVDESLNSGIQFTNRSSPETFIRYFLNNSQMLVEFLENVVNKLSHCSPEVYTTLLEHYLEVWSLQKDVQSRNVYEAKIMKLLESPELTSNNLQAMILCREADFKPGLLYLYEQNNMFKAIMKYHLIRRDYDALLTFCKRFEHQDPNLWVQALWSISSHQNLPQEVLTSVLNAIERGNLLSPLFVLEALSHTQNVQLKNIRYYLKNVIGKESSMIEKHHNDIEKFKKEISEIQKNIEDYKTKPASFQASRCGLCNKQLELPTVHFLCQHSFHKSCVQSFAEHDNECPSCEERNRQTIKAIRSQEENTGDNEVFHSQLEQAKDGFSIVADYIGRGIFTKLTNFNRVEMKAASMMSKMDRSLGTFTGYQESKIERSRNRDQENRDSYERKATIPQTRSDRISPAVVGGNPFGDCEEEEEPKESPPKQRSPQKAEKPKPANPFGEFDEYDGDDEIDDYDKNFNPFFS